jgi:phage shock protein E
MKLFAALGFLLLATFFFKMYKYAVDSPLHVSPEAAKSQITSGQVDVILDVRTKTERDLFGSYPGSVHVPSAAIDHVTSLYSNKNTRFLLYCNTGQRARKAAETLKKLGYNNVSYISGTHTSLF